jgi:hypothetical protein
LRPTRCAALRAGAIAHRHTGYVVIPDRKAWQVRFDNFSMIGEKLTFHIVLPTPRSTASPD